MNHTPRCTIEPVGRKAGEKWIGISSGEEDATKS